MEKWVVIVVVWAMCAACAVLFIRGATVASTRRAAAEDRAREAASTADTGAR